MSEPTGEIEIYLGSVGRSPDDPSRIAEVLALLMPDPVEFESMEDDGVPASVFWEYRETGVEIEWSEARLVAAHLFVRESPDQGYRAYARRLFQEFPNDATRAEIEAALGEPDAAGEWNGTWIRYDYDLNTLHFSLGADGRANVVGVAAPIA